MWKNVVPSNGSNHGGTAIDEDEDEASCKLRRENEN